MSIDLYEFLRFVTVVRAIVGDSLVPIPVRDEILTIKDAVGSCVARPKELVVIPGAKAPTAAARKKGAPIQRDVTSCEYYVMCYMKDIVEDDNMDPVEKWGTRAGTRDAQTYTTQQLDEVREEWAKHMLTFPDH
ncbi:hypothetical protein ACLB2K_031217 [Fragaria x ananassa]